MRSFTYIAVKRSQGTRVGLGLALTFTTVGHLGDSLVAARALDAIIQNVVDGTAEPVTALVSGSAGAVLDQGRGRARRGEQCDAGSLHGEEVV